MKYFSYDLEAHLYPSIDKHESLGAKARHMVTELGFSEDTLIHWNRGGKPIWDEDRDIGYWCTQFAYEQRSGAKIITIADWRHEINRRSK